ncbi:hypothetical protein [Actinotalea sp. K2]|uniref:hypothetical protein n=1 Tax=Actinotalea sp. K2 TaxID=2939438 RepID=UPI002017276F|nr:hypothetical protein [Actinotalea sp. K2]MCL3860469.1 hypothetical protein [Actinotalea sp. K2]
MPEDEPSWREARSDAAEVHASALERRRAAESARARELIAEFVTQADVRGIPPTRLRVRSYDGRSRYRTSTSGWYLRKNESVAVGTDGEFYLLTVPASLRSLVLGASLVPSDPPLVLGAGGRDGESIALEDALRITLGDSPTS